MQPNPQPANKPKHRLALEFPLGQTVATPGALEALQASGQSPLEFLARHARNDWGDVSQEDWDANDLSMIDGNRLLSAYHTKAGKKLWIITEADRSVTTLHLPEEY